MLDYAGIFKKLNKRKIKYIVVGGMAVNLHGIPRMTYDIDLILYLEETNIKKFLNLMKAWGFRPKAPVDIMDFAKQEKRDDWVKNKNMKAFNLVNPNWGISEIDIVINTPVNYENAHKDIVYYKLGDVRIPTLSIYKLVKMKEASNREQDKKDIKYLRKIKNG